MKRILFGLAVTTVTTILMGAVIIAAQQKNLDRIEDGVSNLSNRIEALEERSIEPISLSVPLLVNKAPEVMAERVIEKIPEEVNLTLSQPELTYLGTFEVTAYCPCPK